ncbi:glycosyltransferase family 2 protein [Methylophilus methylotrophus]|uniref:glycosyltransferase family 2 protein n=1 Tax=Methylophilus methylotrophus TaxID=17 RepID=UPI00036DBB1E|nr:glycosyltransferase family 2 protein [Methylophilus methylotrophus]
MQKIAIVILNWHGGADTAACIESLGRLKYSNFNVIIVDNASTDNSIELITNAIHQQSKSDSAILFQVIEPDTIGSKTQPSCVDAKFNLIKAPINGGFAYGNNFGINAAMSDARFGYVWILNNDVVVDPDALNELVNKAEQSTSPMVGSLLVYFDDRQTIQCVGGVSFNIFKAVGKQVGQGDTWTKGSNLPEPDNLSYIAGASMLVNMEAIRQFGIMDERYFLYYEEMDWALQLAKAGKMVVATKSIVFHKEGASIGTSSRSKRSLLSYYYLARNLVIFYRKNYPLLLIFAILRNLREALREINCRDLSISHTIIKATWHGLLGKVGK